MAVPSSSSQNEAKAAMARTLERLKARKKNSFQQQFNNGSDQGPSQVPVLSVPNGSSGASESPALSFSYSFSTSDGNIQTCSLPIPNNEKSKSKDALLPPRKIIMTFYFPCHLTFNVPLKDQQIAQRDYVALVWNYGIIFEPGYTISKNQMHRCVMGATISTTFTHSDPARKSYNEITISPDEHKNYTYQKPATAVTTLQAILNKQSFFLQESAFRRVHDYMELEFGNFSWVSFAKLLLGWKLEDFANVSMPTDSAFLLAKVKETKNELSEVEIVPSPSSQPEKVAMVDKIVNENQIVNESRYHPLTVQEESFVLTCSQCSQRFMSFSERLLHYGVQPECGNPCKKELATMINATIKSSHYKCSVCQKFFDSALDYCLHRDTHRYLTKVYACAHCGKIIPTPSEFTDHKCILEFLTKKLEAKPKNVELSPHITSELLTCRFCNKKGFPYISGLIIHMLNSMTCAAQLANTGKNLSTLLMSGRIEAAKIPCNSCDYECDDQVSYLFHIDHHRMKNESAILCKHCGQRFDSACWFYRHSCQKEGPSEFGCLICLKIHRELTKTDISEVAIDIKEEMIEDIDDREDEYFSYYNRERSLWKEQGNKQEREDWVVCVDCDPHQILNEADDSVDKHFNQFSDHFRMYPAWWYSKFNLYVPDIAKSKKYSHYFSDDHAKRKKLS